MIGSRVRVDRGKRHPGREDSMTEAQRGGNEIQPPAPTSRWLGLRIHTAKMNLEREVKKHHVDHGTC